MPGRLAIDFGTSNTVVSLWNEERKEGSSLTIPGYSRQANQLGEPVAIIPSLIHYAGPNSVWIGDQVLSRGLYNSRHTFRWMKQYISNRSPIQVRVGDREISPYQAGKDFLQAVLASATGGLDLKDEEVAFSVPVESFEHYEDWLSHVAEAAGIGRYRVIDEPSAAALGYNEHIQPGSVYLIFDFGGGTLHTSVVLIEPGESARGGRRCRVLGKAGKSIGGTRIDQWLYQEVLKRNHYSEDHELIRQASTALLVACEQLKERLSFEDQADLLTVPLADGSALAAHFSRAEFEDLLDRNNLFTDAGYTIRTALNAAQERGYTEDRIQSVLMVGGSCQIPAIQRQIRQTFGREKVRYERPLDAVARGTAAFISGADFFDHIQHDYAIRYVDPNTNAYEYYTIVKRGTAYPTQEPVARLSVKGSHTRQRQLGLSIFEIGERRHITLDEAVELVFDPSGAARITQITPQDALDRSLYWMNEKSPTFLVAEPPAETGEPRFEVTFDIDANKRLLVTARDLLTGSLVLQDIPVVHLS